MFCENFTLYICSTSGEAVHGDGDGDSGEELCKGLKGAECWSLIYTFLHVFITYMHAYAFHTRFLHVLVLVRYFNEIAEKALIEEKHSLTTHSSWNSFWKNFKTIPEEFRNSHGGTGTGSSYLSYSNCDMFRVTL